MRNWRVWSLVRSSTKIHSPSSASKSSSGCAGSALEANAAEAAPTVARSASAVASQVRKRIAESPFELRFVRTAHPCCRELEPRAAACHVRQYTRCLARTKAPWMREYHEFHGRRATGAAKLLINGEPVGEVNNNRQVLARFSATETHSFLLENTEDRA